MTAQGSIVVGFRSRRARAIDAPPHVVWPWLVQMGYGRGGWYAIDVVEKALGVGRFATGRSARRVEPTLQGLAVGDRMPLSRTSWLEVAALDAPRRLELVLPPGRLRWTWNFTLEPIGDDATMLTIDTSLSVRADGPVARAGVRAAFVLFGVAHGVMETVQLRTLARRVPAASRDGGAG